MVNYVLLNSRHKLGGYTSFSEYFFDENFSRNNNVGSNLNDIQKGILESKKNYNFLATYSFNEDLVNYNDVMNLYYNSYKEYTNFKFYIYKNLGFIYKPVLKPVKKLFQEKMEK